MATENYRRVTTVNGTLQAVVVQSALQKAGVPVCLRVTPSGAYLDVCVPERFVYDARNLLYPQLGALETAPARA